MDNTLSHQERTGAAVSHDSVLSLGILIAGMQIILLNTEILKENRNLVYWHRARWLVYLPPVFTFCQRVMQVKRSIRWSGRDGKTKAFGATHE